MDFLELRYKGKTHTNRNQIIKILNQLKLYWLIDSEVDNSIIEIEKDTVIWHGGIFMSGNWHYGIFKNGEFYGTWENGIWEKGYFDGKWISGVKLN
jgi:hypothetical protein